MMLRVPLLRYALASLLLLFFYGTSIFELHRLSRTRAGFFSGEGIPTFSRGNFLALPGPVIDRLLSGKEIEVIAETAGACPKDEVTLAEASSEAGAVNPYYLKQGRADILDSREPLGAGDFWRAAWSSRNPSALFAAIASREALCLLRLGNAKAHVGDRFTSWHMPFHPFAKVLTLDEAMARAKAGAILVDVRDPGEFQEGSLNGARSAPYFVARKKFWAKPFSLRDIDYQNDRFEFRSLDGWRGKELVVFGFGPKDVRAFRALARLHAGGAKDLAWFWGGMQAIRGETLEDPFSDPCCQFVDAKAAKAEIAAGALPIFVTRDHYFRLRHIPGSIFYSGIDSLPANGATRLLIYGHDEFSPGPLAVARALAEHGDRRIFYLRRGFSEWSGANRLDPVGYPIVTSDTFRRLQLSR